MNERYARQLQFSEIGYAGRAALRDSSIVVVGAGGLGSTYLLNMTGLGVGKIRLIDGDTVSASNLDRQFLYTEKDLGESKASVARNCLHARNSDISVEAVCDYLKEKNAEELLLDTDLVVLAVDNVLTRKVVNSVCCSRGIPFLNGGVNGMYGSVQLVIPGTTPCLFCSGGIGESRVILPSQAPVVSWTASVMAQCSFLFLLGRSKILRDKLLYLNGNLLSQSLIPIQRALHCLVCGLDTVRNQ